MKTFQITQYACDTCGHIYGDKEECASCESQPVTQDRGVKVGDEVLITQGGGLGHHLKVEKVFIIDKYWGHHAWKRYWHTVALDGTVIDSYGSRMLTFDAYEVIK